ncbi:MAG: TonB-dependent receptor [Candidatus Marinimicrobia bacterium]|nr:TonB-dependent receptor [Candidatus Neomarinimicrobiota bacterium]
MVGLANNRRKFIILTTVIMVFSIISFSQTTGKISGRVFDKTDGNALPGANVILVGTSMGAAADNNGDFYIINVRPGKYNVRVQMIGYNPVTVQDVRVSVNRTEYLEIGMTSTVLKGQEVVVTAQKISVRKDVTSTVKNVSSDEIEALPIESVSDVVSMQAGVVKGHFRGGRPTEVSYMIDGIPVNEGFGGEGRSVDLEPESIQDLEVITGTFNAEYGQAMSGIVNAVTKVGNNEFHGSISGALGNYYTPHDDIFIGLDPAEINRNRDYKVNLNGPVLKDKLFFLVNYRYQNNKNHLNGYRLFNVDDFSYYSTANPLGWYTEYNGDSSYVPMNRSINSSFMGKLSANIFQKLKVSALATLNNDEWHNYDHMYKYNPDGMATQYRSSYMYALNINHMLSNSFFYELKFNYINNYYGNYVYKDPTDSRYIHDVYSQSDGPGFFTGGQQKHHTQRTQIDQNAKFDITWQINKNHSLKTGFHYTQHIIDSQERQIQNVYRGLEEEGEFYYDIVNDKMKIVFPNYIPETLNDTTIYTDSIYVKPVEYAVYFQDKMEFDDMVINFGIRYDYFDANKRYPTQWRNPANKNQFDDPEKMSRYVFAKPKTQLSPRIGLSYQLGSAAVLHFSYGHFFQMPPAYAMYVGNSYRVAPTNYETILGNPTINAQRTVTYEVGLWQELMTGMDLEVSLYYRDIYDLLSVKVVTTYDQIRYGLYTNKDYGNARGLEIKYKWRLGDFSTNLNYTLQYTRGNADNPVMTFDRAGDSIDPIAQMIPMSWDQRHTLNVTVGYNAEKFGANVTGYFDSGTPYSWSPVSSSTLFRVNLLPNNSWMPAQYNFDFNGYYNIPLSDKFKTQLTLTIYNLFDRLNEVWVNSQTGRAYTAIVRDTDLASHKSEFNDYYDRIHNPTMYSAPRLIKVGIGIDF